MGLKTNKNFITANAVEAILAVRYLNLMTLGDTSTKWMLFNYIIIYTYKAYSGGRITHDPGMGTWARSFHRRSYFLGRVSNRSHHFQS